MMPYTDDNWDALFAELGREDIKERPWFADHRQRLLDFQQKATARDG